MSGDELVVLLIFFFFSPHREAMAKSDEGVAAPASGGPARLRFFSMKRTVSQQSFDGVSLDSGGPEDRISVDSDGSDSFVMLLESGRWEHSGGSWCLRFTAAGLGWSRPNKNENLVHLFLWLCLHTS